MDRLKICKTVLSFKEIPALAEKSERSVLFLRHSMRESLKNGNIDPGLTAEGWDYAVECGSLLSGLKDVCFGASLRKRTFQTAQAIMQGAGFEETEIKRYQEITDNSIFTAPENLENSLTDSSISALLKDYFFKGEAAGMYPLREAFEKLLRFLTETEFEKKNCILTTHDIIAVTLLFPLDIYPFVLDDWCGYIQGAALFMDKDGKWQIFYTVPDAANRPRYALFV